MEAYLEKLVSFYSVSTDQEAVGRLLDYVEQCLSQFGLKTKRLKYNGVHNLYAASSDGKHTKVLLQGHIDVVPGENQPFKKADGKYLGRGVYDMLYATASYLYLCEELQAELKHMDIAIMLSGDEEIGGANGVEAFLKDGYTADICVLPDAGEGFGTLSVAAKGVYEPLIRVHGKAHHGSRPWEGNGAAGKLVYFLVEVEQLFDASSHQNTTLTIATLKAGDANNRGPSFADVSLDIRYKDKADLERVELEIERLLEKYDGEILEVERGSDYQLDLQESDVQAFIALYEKHAGKPIEQLKANGSSDARFFAERNIPVIMLRPDGGDAHGDNEWLSIESFEKYYALLKEYVAKTAKSGDKK